MLNNIWKFLVHRFREPSTRAAIGAGVAIFLPDRTDEILTVYDAGTQILGAVLLASAALGNDDHARIVTKDGSD